MRIKISIPQVRCRNVTHPRTAADEIYLSYFISLAKSGEDINRPSLRKYVAKKVSEVKRKVKKNKKWTPENMETIVGIGSAEALYLTIGIYEHDNGKIYRRLVEESDVLINPDEFDWSVIELPTDITNYMGWIKCLWKFLAYGFNYLMEDDLIGTTTIAIPNLLDKEKREWTGSRELKFKAWGGDYRVAIDMEIIEDDRR